MRPALLLVDLQNDYLRAPGLEPPAGEIVARAAALLAAFRRRGLPVVHAWTTVHRDRDDRMPHWRRAGRWLCVEGTEGHAPPVELRPEPGETIAHKTFYSAFDDPSLAQALREQAVDAVVVAGLYLHGCVRATVLDAYRAGFEVWVADDAVASDDPLHAAATRRWLADRAARFESCDAVVARLDEAAHAADESDVADATARARAALPVGPEVRERLERLARAVDEATEELALLAAAELGKPVRYGRVEMARAAALCRAAARLDDGAQERTGEATVRRVPLGVVATVTPFNNPVGVPLGKIAPALALGNAVVWKPSPAATSVSRRLLELARSAGFGDELTLLEGGGTTARRLMADPEVDAVTLTGGSTAGYAAQEACGRRRIPLQAELGGNNAAIVWTDADLDRAASLVAEAAFGYAGQRCTANRRVVVSAIRHDELVERLERATRALGVGDPLEPDTHVGPLVSRDARDRVASVVGRARASFVLAEPLDLDGAFHAPTIVGCDDADAEIVQEETFGPVLVVQPADDFDQALALCNGVRQGLVAALFSESEEHRSRFLAEALAGVLKLSSATADVGVEAPFGGWKHSGVGPPEHGRANVEFYTRAQAVYG